MSLVNVSSIGKTELRTEFFSLLQNFETFPASQNFFVVQVERVPEELLNNANLKELGIQYNYGNLNPVHTSFKRLLNGYFYLSTGVDLTTEKTSVQSQGITKNGYLPVGPFMESREYPDNDLEIQFQETNVSFVDHIIRPWIQLYSIYGNFPAGVGNPDLTTNITVYFLSKETITASANIRRLSTNQENVIKRVEGPIVRKTYKYYDCIPYNIQSANVAEFADQFTIGNVATSWRFSKYDVISPFT